jgi:tRNA 2-thiouridine synthesizing protein E
MLTSVRTDKEGYLLNRAQWNEEIAQELASSVGIILGQEHWAVIHLARRFHEQFDVSPAMRVLVKRVKLELGDDLGNSIALMRLFPGSPAKLIARIAGLPRPTNCI